MPTTFDVFISYSRHASTELAVEIEHGMQRLAKPWNQLRAVSVFRDDSSMSANPALWPTIQSALNNSRWLVVLAAPDAAQSLYVNQEISEWLRLKGSADQILVVHAGGTIEWDRTLPGSAGDFSLDSTAIPPALRNAFSAEPRWVQMDWFDDPDSTRTADPRFRDRVADLSSPVRGVEKRELIGEDVRQHRRTRRLARSGVTALVVMLIVALIAGFVALVQRSSAIEQRNEASQQSLISRARQLSATAVDRVSTDAQSALVLATTAYRSHPESQTASALHRVLTHSPQLQGFYDFGSPVTIVDGTDDGQTIFAATESGKVFALQRTTGERKELFDIEHRVDFLAATRNGDTVVASGSQWSEGTERRSSASKLWNKTGVTVLPERAVALSPSGHTVAVRSDEKVMDESVSIVAGGRIVKSVPSRTSWVTLPDDDTVVGLDEYGNVMRTMIRTGSFETSRLNMGLHMFGGSLAESGGRFTFIRGGDEIEVWDFGGKLPNAYAQSPFVATTSSSLTQSVDLSDDGTKLATLGDGVIYVSDVTKRGTKPEVIELQGAGSATMARLVSNSHVMSVSGSSVAVWDLNAAYSMATTLDATLYGDCNACAAAPVLVSPDGRKVVVNPGIGFVTVADLGTRYTKQWSILDDSEIGRVFNSKPKMVWLDNDRLFVTSSERSQSWILGGEHVDEILHTGSAVEFTQARRRADGTLLIVSSNKLMTLDPISGATTVLRDTVTALSPDGTYGMATHRTDKGVAISVFATDNGRTLLERELDGQLMPFIAHTDNSFTLLRASASQQDDGSELIAIDMSGKHYRIIGKTDLAPSAPIVATDDAIYLEGRGEILKYSTSDGSRMSVLTVLSSPAARNALGISAGGALVVASEPAQKFFRIPVNVDEWVDRACSLAGRDLGPADIQNVLQTTDRLKPGCGKSMPPLTE